MHPVKFNFFKHNLYIEYNNLKGFQKFSLSE